MDYQVSPEGRPLNIRGRTGLKGRGVLGRWGPNHAADPIVTRWAVDERGEKITKNNKYVLEFVAIQRRDNGQWAIPGGEYCIYSFKRNIVRTYKRAQVYQMINH